jgi:hypothetical protein
LLLRRPKKKMLPRKGGFGVDGSVAEGEEEGRWVLRGGGLCAVKGAKLLAGEKKGKIS